MFTYQQYASILGAFQRSPNYRSRKTVRVLMDVLAKKFMGDDVAEDVFVSVAERFCLEYTYAPGLPGPVAYMTTIMRGAAQDVTASRNRQSKTASADFANLMGPTNGTLVIY